MAETNKSAESDERRPIPAEVDQAIRSIGQAQQPEQAALTLAAIANRAIAELNKLARAEANNKRGTPEWGSWASLANSARDAALKTATCRKVATELAKG